MNTFVLIMSIIVYFVAQLRAILCATLLPALNLAIALKIRRMKPPAAHSEAQKVHRRRQQGALMVGITGVLVFLMNFFLFLFVFVRNLYSAVLGRKSYDPRNGPDPEATLRDLELAASYNVYLFCLRHIANVLYASYALNFYLMVWLVASFRKAAVKHIFLPVFGRLGFKSSEITPIS